MAAVAALMRGEEPPPVIEGEPGEPPGGDGGTDEPPGLAGVDEGELKGKEEGAAAAPAEPRSLDDVAELAGLTRGQLNAIPVQIGDKVLTLGELKAKLPELAKVDATRAELEEQRGTIELRRVDTERRMRALLDAAPPGALRELESRMEAAHSATMQRESELLLSARREWAEPTYREAERTRMAKVAKRYGFEPAEIGAMVDHRQVLLLQDFARLTERMEEIKAAARKTTETTPLKGGAETIARTGAAQSSTRRASSQAEKASAAARILNRR